MTVKVTEVLQRAIWLLQDEGNDRWTVDELVQWFNDAQTAMQNMRPDTTSVLTSLQLAPGAFQNLMDSSLNLPRKPAKLLKVVRNTSTAGRRRAIRLVSRDLMDVTNPDWESDPPQTDCVNYMIDTNFPACFWVYPAAPDPSPLIPAMQVELHYSAEPQKIDPPGEGKTWKDVVGDVSVRDRFAMILPDYIVYRAYLKDAEFGGNGSRAQTHFEVFQTALQADMQGTLVGQPSLKQPVKAA